MTNTIPSCNLHGPMKARKGRWGYFWSCGTKLDDGTWCTYKPPKGTAPPNSEQIFSADLDKTQAKEEKQIADTKRNEDIRFMNSITNAVNLICNNKDDISQVEKLANKLYNLKKP